MAEGFAKETGASITITDKVDTGVKGVDVIYTDVWASMGEEDKIPERIKLLKPYQINKEMEKKIGNPDYIFLHCLPCFHNLDTKLSQQFPEICEATDDIFEQALQGFRRSREPSPYDQSRNGRHSGPLSLCA